MKQWLGAGAALAVGLAARPVVNAVLGMKFSRDVDRLNGGDYAALLGNYRDDAVLEFNDGPHRWAGSTGGRWQGRNGIEAFLREYVRARVQGTIVELWSSGPPWALTLVARFDDHADSAEGERLYANQAVLVVQTRLGKIVRQQDFYVDTLRIVDFDRALTERGVGAVG